MNVLQYVTQRREAVRYELICMIWRCEEQRGQCVDASMLCALLAVPDVQIFSAKSDPMVRCVIYLH